jgi:DNA polymerase-1
MDIIKSGESIHNINTIVFFNLDCDPKEVPEKFPRHRKVAKNVGFALFYGAGSSRIKHVFTAGGFPITDDEAKKIHQRFKDYYKEAILFHKEITKAFESGSVLLNLFGRPLIIPDKKDAYMKGFNMLVQSSASDLTLHSAYKASQKWNDAKLDAHILLLIHDFILAEVKEDQAKAADDILVDSLINYDLSNKYGKIVLEVDGGISHEWKK